MPIYTAPPEKRVRLTKYTVAPAVMLSEDLSSECQVVFRNTAVPDELTEG